MLSLTAAYAEAYALLLAAIVLNPIDACCVADGKSCYAMQRGQFGEAFELTSNNRVDLNVIVDYAWPHFLTHADDFVREVQVSHAAPTSRPPDGPYPSLTPLPLPLPRPPCSSSPHFTQVKKL